MAKDREKYQKAIKVGLAYNKSQRWKDAFTAFRVAVGEFPNDAAAYAGLGEACLGLKQLDRALDCFKLAARYSKGDIRYLRSVADIQERQGQLAEAARTYLAIGEILLKQRHLEEAIGNWERSIRLDSSLLGSHKRLAMVFQRLHRTRDAVREYLAIARILQMRGENKKAMQMCQAALRLDPGNDDVLTAVELIRHGDSAFDEPEEEEEPTVSTGLSAEEQAEADSLTETVRQMAAIFEAERNQQVVTEQEEVNDPVEKARRLAQEELAAELFREEDEAEASANGLSKLERDALLGQAMDFETRGHIDDAIGCYQRAIKGGLQLPAAYFMLGLLYINDERPDEAKKILALAAKNPTYLQASKLALSGK
ncbi:MAG: tetratricopeptide repeat protein [Ardenticatenaceae bacterium]|nr:tetratricopeptide repeat protein [Ardenticatenaceae bacterium]